MNVTSRSSWGSLALAFVGVFVPGVKDAAYAKSAAGSFVALAATRTTNTTKQNKNEYTAETQIIGAAAAYGISSGAGIGAKYFQYTESSDLSADYSVETTGYGPMVSFVHDSGVFGAFTFLLQPEKKFKLASAEVTHFGGQGYIVDIGKVFLLGDWGVGFQLSQSSVTFSKQKLTGTETDLDGNYTDTSLCPLLNVFVFF